MKCRRPDSECKCLTCKYMNSCYCEWFKSDKMCEKCDYHGEVRSCSSEVFYCAKCDTLDINFRMTNKEKMIRGTWSNFRDGYGGIISHLICPHCGYVLSGYIDTHGKSMNEGYINYIKHSIEMYSSKNIERGYIKFEDMDYIAHDQMNKKLEKYKDNNNEFVQDVLDTMCAFD